MVYRIFLVVALFSWVYQADAQVKRKIKRGRRNKSEAQLVLDPGKFQVEWEIGHESINDTLSTFVHPNIVLRYGWKKNTDLSMELNSLTTRQLSYAGKKNTTGIEPVLLGVDHVFMTETERRPSIVGGLQLALPFVATASYKATHLGANAQLSVGRTVRQSDVVTLSGGLFWDGFTSAPIYTYGLDYLLQFGKYAASTSWFGFIGSGLPQHNLDLSLIWQPNDRFQLGLTGGLGLNSAAHKNYLSINGVIPLAHKDGKQKPTSFGH